MANSFNNWDTHFSSDDHFHFAPTWDTHFSSDSIFRYTPDGEEEFFFKPDDYFF